MSADRRFFFYRKVDTMEQSYQDVTELLRQTVKRIRTQRPAYGELLAFFEAVFLAQENSRQHVRLEPVCVPEEILAQKKQQKLPLLDPSEFVIDRKETISLLNTLCGIAQNGNPKLSAEAELFQKALDSGFVDLPALSDVLLQKTFAWPEVPGVGTMVMNFLTYHSILPSLAECGKQAAALLEKEEPWKTGYCPVCGGMPCLSILGKDGERNFVCSFCTHRWSVPRMFCAFCSNTDTKTLHYFSSEEESEYRVDVCENCSRYIKTVDTRKTDRFVYPLLEMIATLHLDMIAAEAGLSPVYDWNPIGI